jgi:MFS transporter, OPA family, solute carrier family 37 (glycerol-3-phosphate transporter), member 3
MVASVLRYGYQYAFMLTSTLLFIGGVFILFGLVPHPTDVGLPATDSEESLNDSIDSGQDSDADNEEPLLAGKHRHNTEKAKPIGFFQAVLLPGVIMYSLCYACLKMVNYSFLFWLPFYLSNKFHWAESVADEISVWYDVGGIVG